MNEAPEVRIVRVKEQIAYLKVLLANCEDHLQELHRNITAWTKGVLLDEAQIGTFKFRIHDFERELDELHAILAARKPKRKDR
jgi:hypothetical protein